MLSSIHITNFALIDELFVEFPKGLTVITGETGAGKSILMDALSLALGERADTAMIRVGSEKAVVEAVFEGVNDSRVASALAALEAENADNLILRREIRLKGSSRCFVNDTPVPVALLKEIGDLLVDIHGQHEHQSLLRTETHLGILDQYAKLQNLPDYYSAGFQKFNGTYLSLRHAYAKKNSIDERKAVIEYYLREIDTVHPQPGEDDEIENELRIAEHAEKLSMLSTELLSLLYDGEHNASDLLGRSKKMMQELSAVDPGARQWLEELLSSIEHIDEVAHSLRGYRDKLEIQPQYCDALRSRSAELNSLKRKFHANLPEILTKAAELRDELSSFESLDETIILLEKQLAGDRAAASSLATKLSTTRKRAAETLATAVTSELKLLGIPFSRFETVFSIRPIGGGDELYLLSGEEKVAADTSGWDVVEFFLSTNVGEDVKPLTKVVSGGEVSRIMLALKSIFAGRNAVPSMVFDEVDVGVSGRIAQKVGQAMKKLAQSHQILAITHLPQIASAGETHLLVEKRVENKRTRTIVRRLEADEHTDEIARLLSGGSVSDATRQSAKELIATFSLH